MAFSNQKKRLGYYYSQVVASQQTAKYTNLDNSSASIGPSPRALANNIHVDQKLLPEECAVVEDLMLRVVECGEAADS
jgi:hypothetical protein